jgi:hypothetical protein
VDDREARKEAQRLGIAHFGSLRILKEAKEHSFIGAVKPALDNLVRSGTYIGGGLYRGIFEAGRRVGQLTNGVGRRSLKCVRTNPAVRSEAIKLRLWL